MRLFAIILITLLPFGTLAATVDLNFNPAPAPNLPEHLQVTPETPLQQMRDALDAALAERPKEPALLHRRGTVLYHLGMKEAAREDWAQAAELDPVYAPDDVMADVREVFVQQGLGDAEATRAQLEAASEKHASNPHFYLIRAEQAMRSRALEEAEIAYLRAEELAPDFFVTKLNLGRYYEFRGQQEKARDYYATATRLAPEHRLVWDFLGEHQFAAADFNAAYSSLQKAEALHPAQPLAEVRFGNLFAETGDQIGARYWYMRGLDRAEAGRYEILVALSDAQMRLGLLKEARTTLDEALSERRTAPVLVARGYVAEELENADEAISLYREAIIVDPGNVVAANNLAMALIRSGKHADEALVHADYVYSKLPHNGSVLGTYALAKALNDEGSEVLPLLNRAIRVAPDDPWLRFFLGRMQLRSGQIEAGTMNLEASVLLESGFPRRAEVEALLSTQQ
ncbi:MAG: tetratricopeptide repeat protein [Paracoccaceae bacterium]|nr:tetratricopeptide repeat protein [Paracoccaceae bacterium]